ncbi:S9 family peptidase [soil metagenome]
MKNALLLLVLVPVVANAQGTKADYDRAATIRQRYEGKVLNLALTPHWFDEGNKFWYEAQRPEKKKEFIIVDCVKGTKTLVKESELPKDAKAANPQQSRRGGGDRPQFPSSNAKSPDGDWQAFVRNDNVWLREVKTKAESVLTSDGKPSDSYNGEFFWSPDSKHLVAMKVKAGGNRRVTLIESSPKDQVQPKVISYDYLKPGDDIPQSKPHLFNVADKKEVKVDDKLFNNPWSLDHIRWDADSSRFTFLNNQRGHQVMRVLAVEAASGDVKAIINEECKTFFDYSNKLYYRWLKDGSILWMSERSGYNHLYRIDGKTGDVKNAVTSEGNNKESIFDGGLQPKNGILVRGVDSVDEGNEVIYIRIMGYARSNPYSVHHARVNIDGSNFRVLNGEVVNTHDVQWSPKHKFLIDTFSSFANPPKHVLRDEHGNEVLVLEQDDLEELELTGWKWRRGFVLPGRDGITSIVGYIVRPSNFDPKKKYPVIEHIYAGPHDFFVNHKFQVVPYEQQMAELGFIVVKMDGMGTNWRSKAFHDVSWQNLQDAGFPDRIAVHKQLAKLHPEMDYSKGCGLFGGSAGGQSTLAGLLHHGDFYKVGVADCGCHDNRMDKIWWNEAWMGWPVGPHYAAQSNVTNAHKLTGKLMLVVGEKDNNVDPATTMQVANALIKANKDFDLLVMPGVGHGAAETPYANRRRQDFFVRNLLGVEPRAK